MTYLFIVSWLESSGTSLDSDSRHKWRGHGRTRRHGGVAVYNGKQLTVGQSYPDTADFHDLTVSSLYKDTSVVNRIYRQTGEQTNAK